MYEANTQKHKLSSGIDPTEGSKVLYAHKSHTPLERCILYLPEDPPNAVLDRAREELAPDTAHAPV